MSVLSPAAIARRALTTVERVILRAIIMLSVLYLALTVTGAFLSLRQKLADDIWTFQLPGGFTTPSLPFPSTGTAVVETASRSTDVWLTVSHVSPAVAWLVSLQNVLGLLMILAVGGSVVFLCLRVLRRRPFVRSMTIMLAVTAFALIVFGSGVELFSTWANTLVTQEITGGSTTTPLGTAYRFDFPGTWLTIGLGVAAVAFAFNVGERMQRDTEGLV
ncbi:hypothetical protein [Compostimonas suwonensis]|uniref:DUF2975 family protein n=1 Tax=Compostimonas suwonensis TaxID=1048394 RepID=A0A2M9C500_9MICO|nr:hypothetical protein [Compostimonas suwonensis]PJJ65611.1 hypothetical protein CLV54_0647 [Compostimonas suwonensis]